MLAGKKVLLVHSSAELYGSDRCLAWMADGLNERGLEVHAVLPCYGPLKDELTSRSAHVHIIDPIVIRRGLAKPEEMLKLCTAVTPAVYNIACLIRRNGIDLVHSNTGVVIGGALAALVTRVPHVWHFREMLTEFRGLWRIHEPFVRFSTSEIICISRAVASQFQKTATSSRITVVHDAIPAVTAKGGYAGGVMEGGPVKLLSVGRIAPYKGQDVLLRAVGILVEEGLDVQLTLVGDVFGDRVTHRRNLERIVAELGLGERVAFAGFQDDVGPFLDESDIFIMPSTRPEGLGLVILEAMAHGKPVIATRGGGVNEVIRDGLNGILVEAGDQGAIAAAVTRIITDRKYGRSLAELGCETVNKDFSLVKMNNELMGIYRRALVKGR